VWLTIRYSFLCIVVWNCIIGNEEHDINDIENKDVHCILNSLSTNSLGLNSEYSPMHESIQHTTYVHRYHQETHFTLDKIQDILRVYAFSPEGSISLVFALK
jgi:hypothetical protein